MKPTGLPPLPAGLTAANRREWDLWLRACVERVKREARATALSGDEQAGRVAGAERVADWLLSSLPAESVAE